MNVPPARAVFPLFVTLTGNVVEVVSVNQFPKFSELGDTVATKVAAVPVPLSATGEPVTVTLAAIVSVPANDPEAVAAIREAERIFNEERLRGATAFKVEPGKPVERLEKFDRTAEQVVIVPRVVGG